jgi:two-component system, NtrC family, sensor kinase
MVQRIKNLAIIIFLFVIVCTKCDLKAAVLSDTDNVKHIVGGIESGEEFKIKILLRKANSSSDADTILHYSRKALQLSERHNLSPALSLILMGYGYVQSGQHTKALKCFTDAANHYKSEKDNIGLGSAYSNIAQTYNSQGNNSNAIYYLKKSIVLFEQENDSSRLAAALNNLGYEYYTIGESDSALSLFASTKLIYENLGLDREAVYCTGNSGLVYAQQKKLVEAEAHLLEAIELLTNYGDDYGMIEFMIEYAHVLQQQGDIQMALDYANKSYLLAESNNISEYKRDAAFRLSDLYNISNKYDSAYYYHIEYTAICDSIKNFETIQRMADLRTEFEVAQKQSEVDILTKRKTVQLIIISSLSIILLLATWLILVYYRNLKRSRKFSQALLERRKELEKQGNELKRLNYIKDKFFSIISHDLRTPISSLGGISFMIKESMESNNKAFLNEIVDYIDQSVLSLSGLLENLLNWAMSQQGKLTYKEERIETKALINEVVGLFTTFIISKDIQLKIDLQDNLFIAGEKNSLMTIFRNLLSNSLKFTPKGGWLDISSRVIEGSWVEICVTDSGIGIAEEKIAGLFELNEDKSTRGTENEKGLGLGLNLVHEFVLLNKGKIEVESTVGVGTKFILQFKEIEFSES